LNNLSLGRRFDRPGDSPFRNPLLLLGKSKPSVGVAKKDLPKLWQTCFLCELQASGRTLAGLISARMIGHGIIRISPVIHFIISLKDVGAVVDSSGIHRVSHRLMVDKGL
jgi:hypothetical protein